MAQILLLEHDCNTEIEILTLTIYDSPEFPPRTSVTAM